VSDFDFEWDPVKALANLSKHGVAFEQAAAVFLDPMALTVYDRAQRQRGALVHLRSDVRGSLACHFPHIPEQRAHACA
jgi:uncharacterized DUF497 family protein